MHSWYLPTLGFSLWPCAALIVVFFPVSIYHERNWRRTLAEYAQARRDAGATDAEWPPADARHLLGVQPWLLVVVAVLLAAVTATGLAALLAWPQRLPGWEQVLNYYDRPFLSAMSVIGAAAIVGAVALAIDLAHQPWAPVAAKVRRAIYAPAEKRSQLFAQALAVDPGVPHDIAEAG